MLKTKWGKRIATLCSFALVLMLLMGNFTVTALAAGTETATTVATKENNPLTMPLAVAVIILLVMCICLMCYIRSQNKANDVALTNSQKKYGKLGSLYKQTKENLGYAEYEISKHEAWQREVLEIYPDVQQKIDTKKHQRAADAFVAQYLQVELDGMTVPQSYMTLDRIFEAYGNLEPCVRKKVNADMNGLQQQFDAFTEAYIREAQSYLSDINQNCKATSNDLSKLYEAIKYYDGLPDAIKSAIPMLLIGKIKEKARSTELHLPLTNEEDEAPEEHRFSFKDLFGRGESEDESEE